MFVMDGLAFASEPKASMKVLDAKAVNGLSRLVIFSTETPFRRVRVNRQASIQVPERFSHFWSLFNRP